MRPPPKFNGPRSRLREFSEDPFDPRFRQGSPLCLTPLGLCVRLYWYYQKQGGPFIAELTSMMRDECPDLLQELERHGQSERQG